MRACRLGLAFAVVAFAVTGAAFKFHALATGAYPPGSRVTITTAEFNDYLRAEVPIIIGPGVRNARVESDNGNIVRGYLDIDFLKVRQAHGERPGWVMSQLLSGERPVVIIARITSGRGRVRVDVLKVSISGIVAEGRTLDFLITNFVLPTFPEVKVGRDFSLDYHIDHLEIRPGAVTVVLGSPRSGA
ncbi:MAG TPA: hypothetical protein VGL72_26115 [Bryobacteraceae bacterium]|jgi:hypothetical protein